MDLSSITEMIVEFVPILFLLVIVKVFIDVFSGLFDGDAFN